MSKAPSFKAAWASCRSAGFVRVVVEDDDYDAARAVIEDWEAANVAEPIPVPPDRTTRGFIAGLIGMAIGIAATYAFLRTPVNLTASRPE